MRESKSIRPGRMLALALLALPLLYAGMCRQAEEPAAAAPEGAREQLQEEIADAEAAAQAERERLAEIAAAERRLEEREARLAAEEERLRQERELTAERQRLAAERAASAERERQLAARQRELEAKARELEERELAEAATPFEPGTGAGPNGGVRDEPWRQLPADREPVSAEPDPAPAVKPAVRPAPTTASLQPGKVLEVEILETLSSRTARVGDTFSGRLVQDLRNADGVLVIPAGAKLIGRVTEVQPLKRVGGQASLGIEFSDIVVPPAQRIGIRAKFVELGADRRKDKKKIAAGAVAGAVLGHILGGDGSKNVLIGAAVGAATGTAVVASAKDRDAEIPAGERLALQLEEVVTVEIRYGDPVAD